MTPGSATQDYLRRRRLQRRRAFRASWDNPRHTEPAPLLHGAPGPMLHLIEEELWGAA